jgi:cation diffusion facilitator family transporter
MPIAASKPPTGTTRTSVIVGMAVAIGQTAALAAAAVLTASAALMTQTITNLADVAVGGFLLIGVVSGERPADARHPLGYGRERFFWSFVAAVGIFVGGFGAAVVETIHTIADPRPTGSYGVGFVVLAVVISLDAVALTIALRPLMRQSRTDRTRPATRLWRGSDPAVTTVILSSSAGLLGGVVAAFGLACAVWTGDTWPDIVASGIIATLLLATSAVLLRANRELLTGRGLPPAQTERMRALIGEQAGVVGVPDVFAVVVGPSSVIVDGDVVFDDHLDVPQVEAVIVAAAAGLRRQWPSVAFVYLNPVAAARPRSNRIHLPLSPREPPTTDGEARSVESVWPR